MDALPEKCNTLPPFWERHCPGLPEAGTRCGTSLPSTVPEDGYYLGNALLGHLNEVVQSDTLQGKKDS